MSLTSSCEWSMYGPEGIEVSLMRNPLYDSRKACKRMHPQYPEYPIDSMRMTFLDFGSDGVDNNISVLKTENTFRWGHIDGTWTPTGPAKGASVAGLIGAYEIFVQDSFGIWIKDVTRCGMYKTQIIVINVEIKKTT